MFSETIEKIKGSGVAQRRLIVVAAVVAVWAILILEQMSSPLWSMETFVQRVQMLSIAALFSGIPGLIAILIMFTPNARTETGSI
ncbi:MAG: hypothetical protein ABSE51_07745 [Terracidiphilus sp.]|jgi:hypothetical protein